MGSERGGISPCLHEVTEQWLPVPGPGAVVAGSAVVVVGSNVVGSNVVVAGSTVVVACCSVVGTSVVKHLQDKIILSISSLN